MSRVKVVKDLYPTMDEYGEKIESFLKETLPRKTFKVLPYSDGRVVVYDMGPGAKELWVYPRRDTMAKIESNLLEWNRGKY